MQNLFFKNNSIRNIPLDRTPIIQMLSTFLKKETVSFHMPGHTGGKSFSKWLHQNALSIDTTELDATDDPNHPERAVKEAALLAAKAFGADKTFFITTGSTTAIYAAFLSVTRPRDKIILFRNVHKSVLNACVMFDLDPVFTTESTLAASIERHPDAVAVFITRPDYYGRCVDIKVLSALVHDAGKILIVDEAHGTHFAFCPSLLPVPSISNGADIVMQSAHKTVPSLTQGSYLHLSREAVCLHRIEPGAVQEALSMINTSSPSFLIAATLDFARAFLEDYGDAASKKLFSLLTCFYTLLDPGWLPCFRRPDEKDSGVSFDPFRLVITVRNMPFTAEEIAEELSGHGIFVEFHDLLRLVLICKFENTKTDFTRLARILNRFLKKAESRAEEAGNSGKTPISLYTEKLKRLDEKFKKIDKLDDQLKKLERLDEQLQNEMHFPPERACPPHCGMTEKRHTVSVPLREAANRTVFSAIVPYPPGIPLVWPGEILCEKTALLLEEILAYGYSIYGVEACPDKESGEMLPHIQCIIDDSCRK